MWRKWILNFRNPTVWIGLLQGTAGLFLLDLWVHSLFGIWPPDLFSTPWRAVVLQLGAMFFFLRAGDNLNRDREDRNEKG